jgi:hypothetical protein
VRPFFTKRAGGVAQGEVQAPLLQNKQTNKKTDWKYTSLFWYLNKTCNEKKITYYKDNEH